MRSNGDGHLSWLKLCDAGVFASDANEAALLEQRRVTPKVLRPDMSQRDRKAAIRDHAARNKLARAAGALWEEIALFLAYAHGTSGRLKIEGSKVTVTPLRSVHPSWHTATLIFDATAPPPSLVSIALFGDEVPGWPSAATMKADIAIRWSDHVHVRQVLGAPVSMGKLGLGLDELGKKISQPLNERDILRFIRLRAALAAPARVGVVSYRTFSKTIATNCRRT